MRNDDVDSVRIMTLVLFEVCEQLNFCGVDKYCSVCWLSISIWDLTE